VALNWSIHLKFIWTAVVTAAILVILIPICIQLSRYDKPDSNWPDRMTD
jgi:hypothetical protein